MSQIKRYPFFDRNREIVTVPYDPGPLHPWQVSWISRHAWEWGRWAILLDFRRPFIARRWTRMQMGGHPLFHFSWGPLVVTVYKFSPPSIAGSYRAMGVR